LQVYDRVLGSRSEATLVALIALVAFLFSMMAILDIVRGQVMARVAARFQARLASRVFSAALTRSATQPTDPLATSAARDLDAVQRLLSSSVLMAIFDVPFAPVFLIGSLLFPSTHRLACGWRRWRA
jgi:ATP-binding cassette subfamily C protein